MTLWLFNLHLFPFKLLIMMLNARASLELCRHLLPTRCGCSSGFRTPHRGWKPRARPAAWSAGGKRWTWPAQRRRGFLSTLCRSCARTRAPRWHPRNQPVRSTEPCKNKESRNQRWHARRSVGAHSGSDFQVFRLKVLHGNNNDKKRSS